MKKQKQKITHFKANMYFLKREKMFLMLLKVEYFHYHKLTRQDVLQNYLHVSKYELLNKSFRDYQ